MLKYQNTWTSTHSCLYAPIHFNIFLSAMMSGLVLFHTLYVLYCYLELFHHHILPVISCDNNPISSRRSLKFHLIKFKQETGGEHSNKSHLFLSYKCCCNTCWKRSGLWTFRWKSRFPRSGLRCVSNDCQGGGKKKAMARHECVAHSGVDQTQTDSWLQMDVYSYSDLMLIILLSSSYH